MTLHEFLGAIHVGALRDLPIAYGVVVLAQGGYFLWVLRGWMRERQG
jgi:hypothetical protein